MANVILIGFMGVGKTTLGRALAKRWGWPFVDLDQEVEAQAGSTIPALFAREGEAAFRAREVEALGRILEGDEQILATGGGTPTRPDSIDEMLARGTVVWLRAAPDTILERTPRDGTRPLLEGWTESQARDRIQELLNARRPCYAMANMTIDVDHRGPDELVEALIDGLKELGVRP
jgi:shikimate kinase